MMGRSRTLLLAAAFALLCAAPTVWAPPVAGQSGAADEPRRLYVVVHTRNDRGRVFCAIWRGPEGYPTQREHAVGEAIDRTVEDREAVCLFEDVTPGEYATAVFHDENANNDLDRNLFGIPSEGTGASNDAINMFGPPRYHDARFRYPSNTRRHRIDVRIHY
ncbi:MAG TPA: DUF2141 domain-containing protein [Sandaracinaceae bacterium LLY-WYZ-13_1]|nr:DUF2141 domain-containing protein [Sandaracinaceae bacterium LLY-WYZ-13_1]